MLRHLLGVGVSVTIAGLLLGVLVTTLGAPAFDEALLRDAHQFDHGVVGRILNVATQAGSFWTFAAITIGIGVAVWLRNRSVRAGLLVALAPIAAALCSVVCKEIFTRPRPRLDAALHGTGYSMPSIHATQSAAFATVVVLLLLHGRERRPLQAIGLVVAGVVFVVLVGGSRIVLGVHYPTDVLAGWLIGAGVAALLVAVNDRIEARAARL
ncbi:MAG: phosphatase PAP2 family protein [Gaiellales bacterium]